MKNRELISAVQYLETIHDELCEVTRLLEDENERPRYRRIAIKIDFVLENVEGLICDVEAADRSLKRRRK